MSLMPFWADPWDEALLPMRLYNQNFGMAPFEQDLRQMDRMMRNMRRSMSHPQSGVSEVVNDASKFQVNLDVSHFAPEEVQVKTVGNNVLVEGKHEEKADEHGFISRTFSRRYVLPKDTVVEQVVSRMSPSGVLTIEAPKMAIEGKQGERVIPIQQSQQEPHALKAAPKPQE